MEDGKAMMLGRSREEIAPGLHIALDMGARVPSATWPANLRVCWHQENLILSCFRQVSKNKILVMLCETSIVHWHLIPQEVKHFLMCLVLRTGVKLPNETHWCLDACQCDIIEFINLGICTHCGEQGLTLLRRFVARERGGTDGTYCTIPKT